MNKVKRILKLKGHRVWKISKEASVLDALKLMAEKQTGSVIVMDGDQIAGIFTERDFARKVGVLDSLPSAVKVKDVMTSKLITVTSEDTVNHCMTLITDHHIRHLPVLENDHLVGIISIGDVVKDIIEELQFAVKQLESYITNFR
jgi:CBS domain-containing protein